MNHSHGTMSPEEFDALIGYAKNQRGAVLVGHLRKLVAALGAIFRTRQSA